MHEVEGGSRAAAPIGSVTYAFTHMGNFLLPLAVGIWTFGLRFGPHGSIWAMRLGFGPQDWDMGLETGIWATRLGYGP